MQPRRRLPVLHEDVDYATHHETPLRARLYRPVDAGSYPALVNVHGGAWTRGDRLDNEHTSLALAASGAIVLAVDFRMPPVAGFPHPVADINYAIRWFKARVPRYGGNPDRVGGIGFSSGGHQLALNALRPEDPRWSGSPETAETAELAFLIVVYAVLDPLARYRMARETKLAGLLDSHHAYWPDEATMEQASPQHILERGEAVRLPPLLIIQGEDDANLTPDMADRFGTAYRMAGGRAEVIRYPDAPHGFLRAEHPGTAAGAALERIINFTHAER